jgi:hypothetical protein
MTSFRKICIACGENKLAHEFAFKKGSRDGRRGKCKLCLNAYSREWRERDLLTNQQQANSRKLRNRSALEKRDPVRAWAVQAHGAARQRSREKGLRYELNIDFIVSIAPTICPLLQYPLVYTKEKGRSRTSVPSLDRIDPSKGYTRDNVWIISWRANTIKNDASLEELEAVLAAWEMLI